ncbi:rhombosortase [Pelagicoccus sp. SDUM812003]|uniref:rhombosortase n=1 Tax=Pelagicoccus sp. SDUM812003 TaxID=3041267 RepID=UPI00280D4996|nr:rhombosortase [Pelagicoccus sp. SDUM812003]MDQ8202428.1 rhombosortase [Pelagicoccus sp. SDUM812003]
MRSIRKTVPWVTLLMGSLALGLQTLGEARLQTWQWRSDAWASSEVWRLVTGHLCHWSWDHLVWDLAVFVGLGAGYEIAGKRIHMLLMLAGTTLLTDVFLRCSDRFDLYRGLSGYALALFVGLLAKLVRGGLERGDHGRLAIGVLGAFLVIGKVGYELALGQSMFVSGGGGGFHVAVEAHLAGGLAAALIACWRHLFLDSIPTGRF